MFSHVQLFRVEASRVKLRTVYWIDRINYYKYGSRVQRGLNLSSIIYSLPSQWKATKSHNASVYLPVK